MMRNVAPYTIMLAITFLVISCSSQSGDIVTPVSPQEPATGQAAGYTGFNGLWQFSIESATGDVEITSLRSADQILNALGFLEPPALMNLSVDFNTLVIDPANSLIEVDVMLKHPIADDTFRGFDVRGVVFGPEVANADGLTIIPGPEYFTGIPFGYIDGLLGTPGSIGNFTGLAGYKYFCDGLGLDEDLSTWFSSQLNLDSRGVFYPLNTNSRHYKLVWDGPADFFVFNYAIYANYDWPVGEPPFVLDDFSVSTANSAEAFCYTVTSVDNGLWYSSGNGGGSVSLQVDIWDWQGDISNVTLDFVADSGNFPVNTPMTYLGPGISAKSYCYMAQDVSGIPGGPGEIGLLVTVTDARTFGEQWFLNLLPDTHQLYNAQVYNCFMYPITVSDCPAPVVEGINPSLFAAGEWAYDVDITGTNFVAGPSLDVRLTLTGEPDVVGDITYSDETLITADFDCTTAAEGTYDVKVTNGCGNEGIGEGMADLGSCTTMAPINSSSRIYSAYFYSREGAACTRQGQSYVVCGYNQGTSFLCAEPANTGSGFGYVDYLSSTLPYGIPVNDIVSDSQNLIYHVCSADLSTLRQIQFNPSSGFGSQATFGSIPAGYAIYRITVDPDDNPVILGYSTSDSTDVKVFHWNVSSWDETVVPSSVVNGSYGNIRDFDNNPSQNHYVFTCRVGGLANLYAIDTNGVLQHSENDVFDYNHNLVWDPGVYIDQENPMCHFAVWGGNAQDLWSGYQARPIVLYDAMYNRLSEGNGSIDNPRLARGPRGAWAPGTNRLFVGGAAINVYTTRYFALPPEW